MTFNKELFKKDLDFFTIMIVCSWLLLMIIAIPCLVIDLINLAIGIHSEPVLINWLTDLVIFKPINLINCIINYSEFSCYRFVQVIYTLELTGVISFIFFYYRWFIKSVPTPKNKELDEFYKKHFKVNKQ